MKSTNLYSNLSTPWTKERMRRYIAVPILLFLAYFLSVLMPLYIGFGNFTPMMDLAVQTVSNSRILIYIIDILAAISASSAAFDYLHDKTAITTVHSMPVTRGSLYLSSTISGFFLMAIPALATALLMLPLAAARATGPASPLSFVTQEMYKLIGNTPAEIFSPGNVLGWFFGTMVICLFCYAISNLAGVITGTNVIHVLTAIFLNVVAFAVVLLLDAYGSMFIYGYSGLTIFEKTSSYFAPYVFILVKFTYESNGNIYPGLLLYLIAAIAIMLLAYLLYKKEKLERVGNSTTFVVAGDVLAALLTFICMSGAGFLLTGGTNIMGLGKSSTWLFIITSVIASALFYMVFRMIADSSTKVFSKGNLMKYIVFMAVILVFFCFSVLDVTNMYKKTPDASDVKSVTVSGLDKSDGTEFKLKDAKNIETVIAMNKGLAETKQAESDVNKMTEDSVRDINIDYTLKDGRTVKRYYSLYKKESFEGVTKQADEVLLSKECRDQRKIKFTDKQLENTEVTASVYHYNTEDETKEKYIRDVADMKALIAAYNRDIDTMKSFKRVEHGENDKYYEIELGFYKKETEEPETLFDNGDDEGYNVSLALSSSHVNTIKFLEDNGFIPKDVPID